MGLANLGKILLVIGGIIVLAGLITFILGKTGFMGKLPGDILIQTLAIFQICMGYLNFYSHFYSMPLQVPK